MTTTDPLPGENRRPVASLRDVRVTYRTGHGRHRRIVNALNGVSVEVAAGRTLGLVGESGSGKTTLGRVLLGLVRPAGGAVEFAGTPLTRRRVKGRLQVVLQNPDHSLNPFLPVWRSVAEPLAVTRSPRASRRAAVSEMLTLVGLDPSLADRHPHELSGGQRQRVAVARAIITRPDLIVFDEAVTALDVSVQTQILNLIGDLQSEWDFAALFISHDIAAVRYIAHDIAVAYRGKLVETGPAAAFYPTAGADHHPYTRQLLAALPAAANGAECP